MEYRGIRLEESVKLYNKNQSYNQKIKNTLDYFADTLKERNHILLSPYKNDRGQVLIDFKCEHGAQWIKPNNYKSGSNCYTCGTNKASKKKAEKAKRKFFEQIEINQHEVLSPFISYEEKILIDFKCEHEPHWASPTFYNNGKNQMCPKCVRIKNGKLKQEKSKAEFFEMLKANGHESLSPYQLNKEKVLIDFKCEHEPQLVTPNSYKQKSICPQCGKEKSPKTRKKPYIKAFKKLVESNGHELLSDYISAREKVLIDFKCGHEPHWMVAHSYKIGYGCEACGHIKNAKELIRKTGEKFTKIVKKNGHVLLSYYINDKSKIMIDFKCGHEPHWMLPNNYKSGQRCPFCFYSRGVNIITDWLNDRAIEYKTELILPKKRWRYDIYIPSYNLIIEVHGRQHYVDEDFFHNRTLEQEQENDRNKQRYAESLGYNYMVVDYREHKPKKALERFLNQFKLYKHNRRNKNQYRRNEEQLSLF
jgi:very-short-patch-repair endonuclease